MRVLCFIQEVPYGVHSSAGTSRPHLWVTGCWPPLTLAVYREPRGCSSLSVTRQSRGRGLKTFCPLDFLSLQQLFVLQELLQILIRTVTSIPCIEECMIEDVATDALKEVLRVLVQGDRFVTPPFLIHCGLGSTDCRPTVFANQPTAVGDSGTAVDY